LPIALAELGHQPAVILPAYRQTRYAPVPVEPMGIDFIVPIGSKTVAGHLLRSHLPGTDVPVYLVQQDHYFDRDELYGVDGNDYQDNCERFVFFSRAVLEAVRLLELEVGRHGSGLVKVVVRDNGVGISPENLKQIFSHGFTTKRDGHGFGLHSGALAAKEMGGELSVASEGLGCGATFTLELPIARNQNKETCKPRT